MAIVDKKNFIDKYGSLLTIYKTIYKYNLQNDIQVKYKKRYTKRYTSSIYKTRDGYAQIRKERSVVPQRYNEQEKSRGREITWFARITVTIITKYKKLIGDRNDAMVFARRRTSEKRKEDSKFRLVNGGASWLSYEGNRYHAGEGTHS